MVIAKQLAIGDIVDPAVTQGIAPEQAP